MKKGRVLKPKDSGVGKSRGFAAFGRVAKSGDKSMISANASRKRR